jgi:hypothetical protein
MKDIMEGEMLLRHWISRVGASMGFRVVSVMAVWVFLFTAISTEAVRLPQFYADMAEASKIKATAVVTSVEIIERTKRSTSKKVVFELRHSFSDSVPATFSGTCYSVDHSWQEPGAGGTIYHYPKKGQRVYVTISADGGSITSYTAIDEALEGMFIENPGKISYGMGKAYLEK